MEGAVEVDGARLWYRVDGAGRDVVLLHAGVADSRMWDAVVAEIGDRARCVRLDLRGFGRTIAEPGAFSPVADVDAVLDALGIRDAVVVGASFGGFVALELAVAHPERVRRLVLLAPPLFDHEWSEEFARFAAAEEAALDAGRIDEAVELNVRMSVPDADPAVQQRVRQMQADAFALQRDPGLEPLELDPPVTARLGEIRAPAVVAHGDADGEDFVAIAQRLARELSDARLLPIAGAGHLPALEQPAVVAQLILEAAG